MIHGKKNVLLFFLLVLSLSKFSFGAEVEALASRQVAEELVGSELAAEMGDVLESGFRETFGSDLSGISKQLSEEETTALRNVLRDELSDIGAAIKNGSTNVENATNDIKSLIKNNVPNKFSSEVKNLVGENRIAGLSEQAKSFYTKLPNFETEFKGFEFKPAVEQRAAGLVESKVTTVPTQVESLQQDLALKSDGVIGAIKSGDTAAETIAKKDFGTAATNLKEVSGQQVEQTTKIAGQTETEVADTGGKGAAKDIEAKQNELGEKLQDEQDAATNQEIGERKTFKQEYEQAKTARDKAQEELTSVKRPIDEKTKAGTVPTDAEKAALKSAEERLATAEGNLKTATENYVTKGSWKDPKRALVSAKQKTGMVAQKTGTAVKAVPGAAKEYVITEVKSLASQVSGGLVAWAMFTAPSMVLQWFEGDQQRQAMLNTVRAVHSFGNMWMKIPGEFINSDQPQNSRFIYIGLDSKDQKITDDLRRNGNYYVSLSEYGDLAKFQISDPNFPPNMLHLNTGYVFIGDGQPSNAEVPSLQLLDPSENTQSPIKEPLTLQKALGIIASIATGQSVDDVQNFFDIDSSGYKGSKLIASLMVAPQGQDIPPLLQNLVKGLQSGMQIGGTFALRGIEPLSGEQIGLLNPSDVTSVDLTKLQEYKYSIARGVYIYQTQDTEFAKMMLAQIKKDDAKAQLFHESLYDYVILVEQPNETKFLSLQVPAIFSRKDDKGNIISGPPLYAINPDVHYLISLVEPEVEIVNAQGQVEKHAVVYGTDGTVYTGEGPSLDAINQALGTQIQKQPEWITQIQEMRNYFENHIKYGPFKIGAQTLEIDQGIADKKLPIYRVPGFLEGGGDDYVISIISNAPNFPILSLLPRRIYLESVQGQQKRQLFVSLVTSRFYDNNMMPPTAVAKDGTIQPVNVPYFIIQKPDGSKAVTTRPPAAGDTQVATGSGPLYTLFVDEALNPTTPLPAGISKLPTGQQWAIKNLTLTFVGDGTAKALTLEQYFEQNADASIKTLQDAIEKSYNGWKTAIENTYPTTIDNQKGPFTWVAGVAPIQLIATSAEDIKQNIYVYTSPSYPDQYLVMSNATAVNGTPQFDQASPQRYAISLSSGQAFDRQNGGAAVQQLTSTFQQLLIDAQRDVKFPQGLIDAITNSQLIYQNRIRKFLYGDDTLFGKFQLYLRRDDFINRQFIYADVTGLGSPLNADGSENTAVTSKIKDYFVVIARTPKKDAAGNVIANEYNYDIGVQLGAAPAGTELYIASLVSGAEFSRTAYVGSYSQLKGVNVEGTTIDATDPLRFTESILKIIADKSGVTSVALQPKITALTQEKADLIRKELDQIAADEALEEQLFQPLDDNVLQNILAAPQIQTNPNELDRYLRKVGEKYYAVTPEPTGPNEPPQFITDYNYDPLRQGKNSMGMIWQVITQGGQKRAEPKLLLEKWSLEVARAYAGVNVGANGAQSLILPVSVPSLPMMIKQDGKLTSALLDTVPPLIENTVIPKATIDSERTLIATGIQKAAVGATLTLHMYYNMLTNSYFMSVKRPDGRIYYVDIQSGFCYDWDGKSEIAHVHIDESPLYQGKKGDYLFVGTDEFNTLKIIFKNIWQDNEYQPYTLVDVHDPAGGIIFGTIAAGKDQAGNPQTLNLGQRQGSLYNLTNDYNLATIQLGYIFKDAAGNPLPSSDATQPFYVAWDFPAGIHFIDQYLPVKDKFYSLLIYQQTRSAGAPIETGSYVDADNFHYLAVDDEGKINLGDTPNPNYVPRMNIVGIVFDANNVFQSLYYKGSLVSLSAAGGTGDTKIYKGTYEEIGPDNKPISKPITISVGPYTFPGTNAQMPIISITDGNKTYDYTYEQKILNTGPTIAPEQFEFDLYETLKNWKWPKGAPGITQSQFIPNIHTQSKPAGTKPEQQEQKVANSPTKTFASVALVGALPPLMNAATNEDPCTTTIIDRGQTIKKPIPGCVPEQIKDVLPSIFINPNANLFIPYLTIANKPINSYLYKLGQDRDIGKGYYPTIAGTSDSYFKNWHADLSNGILYMATGQPAGFALLPSQLAELLDTINLSVELDPDGYPIGLQYRSFAVVAAELGETTPAPGPTPAPAPTAAPAPRTAAPLQTRAARALPRRPGRVPGRPAAR